MLCLKSQKVDLMQKTKSSQRLHYIIPWRSRPELYNRLDRLEKTIEYTFKDKKLLYQAFTHSSMVKKVAKASDMTSEETSSFERLEFLGDAVLNLVVAHFVFKQIPLDSEGELSKLRSLIVNEAQLARVAKDLNLGKFLVLGDSELSSLGHKKLRILADCLEALIGALFEDGGFAVASAFLLREFDFAKVDFSVIKETWNKDYKSLLQEHLQATKKGPPVYELISTKGVGENQVFKIGVFFENQKIAEAQGVSKKIASQKAALKAWTLVNQKTIGKSPGKMKKEKNI